MNWTTQQQVRALSDGWMIVDNSDHGQRIERYDEMARFDCDAAAQAYVALRAINGDPLARSAWDYLAYQHAVSDAAELG